MMDNRRLKHLDEGLAILTRNKKTPDRPADGQRPADVPRSQRPLSADLQAHIGVRLKAFYDSVLSEPIPDRFSELLDRLDAADTSKPASEGGGRTEPVDARAEPASEDTTATSLAGGSDVRT